MPNLIRRPLATLAHGAALAGCLWSTTALAGQREDFLAALEASWRAVGATEIRLGEVSGSDDSFVVKDITVKMMIENEPVEMTAGPTTFTNARANADKSYRVGEMKGTDLAMTGEDTKASVKSYTIANYVSPAPETLKAAYDKSKTTLAQYDAISLSGVVFEAPGEGKAMDVESVELKASGWKDFLPRAGSVAARGLAPQMDDKAKADLAEYGYDRLVMDIDGSGTWNDVSGTVAIDRLDVTMRGMALMKFNFTLEGVTAEVIKELTALSGATDEAAQARQLELLQNLAVRGAQLRLENQSLVGKVLDKQAKEAGMSRKEYVKTLTMALPMMLASLKNKAFEKEVATSVRAFLDDPKSLSIRLTPKEPVSVAQIMGSAMMAPHMLPATLAASVKAND